jgi:hypothetical protein
VSVFQCANIQEAAPGSGRAVASHTGLNYRLRIKQRMLGTLFEVDMAPFIAPDILPVEQRQRPLQAKDFDEADAGSNWLPPLSIE